MAPRRMPRIRKRWKFLLVAVLLLLVYGFLQVPFGYWTGRPIHVSVETTWLTEPLTTDGRVDYAAALNERLSRGVTAENNAFIGLAKAIEILPAGEELNAIQRELGVTFKPGKPLERIQIQIAGALAPDGSQTFDDVYHVVCSRAWRSQDFPKLAAALDAQRPQIESAIEAISRPKFWYPFMESHGLIGSMEESQPLRDLARCLMVHSFNSLGDGKYDQALEYLIAIRRLQTHLKQSLSWLLQLAGDAIGMTAFEAEQAVIGSGRLSPDQLERYLQFLDDQPSLIRIADRIGTIDRCLQLELYQLFAYDAGFQSDFISAFNLPGDTSLPIRLMDRTGGLINWNAAMTTSNEIFDRFEDAAAEPQDHLRIKRLRELENEIADLVTQQSGHAPVIIALLSGPSARGTWAGTYTFQSSFASAHADREIYRAMERDLTRVAIAVQLHRSRIGEYPSSLESLVPGFLKKLPTDRLTGGKLTYNVTKTGFEIRGTDSYFEAKFQD